MLDQILGGLKGNLGDVLSQNNLSADKLDDLVGLTGESITETAGSEVVSGNMSGIMDLLKGNGDTGSSNPIVSNIISSLVGKVTSSFGLSEGAASGIASSIIPMAIKAISSKFNSEGGDESALTSMLGLGGGGMMDKAKDLLGGFLK
jgi:hypothetical protein